MIYDIVVIGAGPAGLAAAIYGKRAGRNILVLDTSSISGGHINYISVKISGIYAQTHALNYKECFPELIRRMSELYQAAIDNPYTDPQGVKRSKFINLDMEEYKDAHLTMKLFKDVLSLPQFKNYEAGKYKFLISFDI